MNTNLSWLMLHHFGFEILLFMNTNLSWLMLHHFGFEILQSFGDIGNLADGIPLGSQAKVKWNSRNRIRRSRVFFIHRLDHFTLIRDWGRGLNSLPDFPMDCSGKSKQRVYCTTYPFPSFRPPPPGPASFPSRPPGCGS